MNKRCNENFRSFFLKNKRGQVTIFIIIAIIIVSLGLLIYSFYPQIKTTLQVEAEETPLTYIQSCVGEDFGNAAEKVSVQGGSINPDHSVTYDDSQIQFLCYTEEYFRPCVIQQPMLKQHIESELTKEINSVVDEAKSEEGISTLEL